MRTEPRTSPKSHPVPVVFSKVTLERIDQEAERAGLSRSALIRFTVRMFLMQAAKRLQGGEK